MDICAVIINSEGDGWKEQINSEGTVADIGGGTAVTYKIDGDDCTLTFKDGIAVQERRGGQNVYIEFEEGKKTNCTFGSGGLSGSYVITTRVLRFVRGKGGIKLYLEYSSGKDNELIKLTFTAVKRSWGIK